MSLRSAATAGTAQTVVSMVLSFISVKVTSVYLGPAGLGTVGQLGYFMAMTLAILAAGPNIGLVRRVAEVGDDRAGRDRVVSTILRGLIAIGVPASLAIVIGSRWLAEELLHDASLSLGFWLFAAVFLFGLVGSVIIACAAGAKDFKNLALINICNGVVGLALMATLSPLYGVSGGLVATALMPLVTCAIAWAIARKRDWWPRRPLAHGFSPGEARSAVTFVPMAVISSVALPLLQILIRDNVATHGGMAEVGLLQGVMRVSDMYLGVATSVFTMYYFQRFSEIKEADELVREARRGFLIIVPTVAVASLIIYLLRDFIVHLIFTDAFLPMRDLFGWQMVGNVLKMIGWLFGYLLLAKANALAMAALELTTVAVWWLLSILFISLQGTVGATEAFATTYALYSVATFCGVVFVVRRMRRNARAATSP
jgi:polysaccharide transporter, PST family